MKKPVPTLYLFNNIFYPQTVIPLTVNDDVSKQMLLTSYQNSTDIALFHPHTRSRGVGTLGKIILVDHNSDGSLSVVVQGLVRIKLLNMDNDDPFPVYHIADYYDIDEKTQTLTDSPIERLHLVLESWLIRHVNSTRERERFMKDMSSPAKLINNLCMFVIKDIELKQIFLESTSLLDRVRMMNALLVGATPETEDIGMCEAIKSFERLETDQYKNAS
ncbi:MAG: LON peptidase substrate-binding domain-containing protein [Bacteriovorax sp.]|nr:LON peptidase substrate-binding domain-containing protein [Bacteriovorax sp.]